MKNKTNFPFLWLCILVLFILGFNSCDSRKKVDCELLSKPISNQYIVYIEKPKQYNANQFEDYTEKVLSNLRDSINVLVDSCMCGVYLFENLGDLDLITRRHEATDDPNLSTEEKKGVHVDYNFDLIVGKMQNFNETTISYSNNSSLNNFDYSVKVAILDSGFDPNAGVLAGYPNDKTLREVSWVNAEEKPNGIDSDSNCIIDDIYAVDVYYQRGNISINNGHGTAVAGIVADFPYITYPDSIDLNLMNIKITHTSDEGTEVTTLFDAVCGMRYAIHKEADVIVASWGYYHDSLNHVLKAVLDTAKVENVTIVAAAGNDNTNIDICHFYPASCAALPAYKNVLSVTALNTGKTGLASFSNFGVKSVLYAAPGENILCIQPETAEGLRGLRLDGTSLAAPYVARAVSIIKALDGNISPKELRVCLNARTTLKATRLNIKNGALIQDPTWNFDSCIK